MSKFKFMNGDMMKPRFMRANQLSSNGIPVQLGVIDNQTQEVCGFSATLSEARDEYMDDLNRDHSLKTDGEWEPITVTWNKQE